MPTTTFENLSEEKKNRILTAAVDEFARNPFSQASINRIVRDADISRGSFYQYFKDKEDLYLLVIAQISREKMKILSSYRAEEGEGDGGFFHSAIASMPAILEWVERCPKYNRIGMLMAQDDSDFIGHVFSKANETQQEVLLKLKRDQQQGLIRQDLDLQLVIDLMLMVTTKLLQEYYTTDGKAGSLQKILQVMQIISDGISTERGRIWDTYSNNSLDQEQKS